MTAATTANFGVIEAALKAAIKADREFGWIGRCEAGLAALLALQREALQRELAEERARLDAMIEHSWKVVDMPSHKDGRWHVWKPGNPDTERVNVATADDPRAAIDAARAGCVA